MHIDRERFLRAALLLSLGGAPLAAGCIVTTDEGTEGQPTEQQELSSGGEAPGQPVQVVGPPAQGVTPVYHYQGGGPVYEGGGPVYEGGGPVYEGGGPAYEGGGPVYE